MTDREKLIGLLYESDFTCNQSLCEECDYLCSNKCKASMMADHLLDNGVCLETKQATSDENKRWIPVSERLPEHGVIALCRLIFNELRILQWDSVSKWWLGYGAGDDWRQKDVTHWMPLPEPPKEENNA